MEIWYWREQQQYIAKNIQDDGDGVVAVDYLNFLGLPPIVMF
jgi:hypothetical protein